MSDPNLKLELTLAPGTVFLGNGGVEKWLSLIGGYNINQDTVAAKPQLQADGLYFDGGDWLAWTQSFSLGTSSPLTIEGYFNTSSPATTQRLVGLGQETNWTPMITVGIAASKLVFRVIYAPGGNASYATAITSGTTTISASAWHHFALVIEQTQIKSYLNGVNEAALARNASWGIAPDTRCQAGAWLSVVTQLEFFVGKMNDIRIYDVAKYTSSFLPPPRSQCALPSLPVPPIPVIATALINQFDSGD